MSNYISISGPYHNGMKPKSFFSATKDLYRSRLILSGNNTKARLSRYSNPDSNSEISPYNKELFTMTPWIIAGASLLMLWIF